MAYKKGNIPWNKGKSDGQIPWNKGTKGKGIMIAWNKGLHMWKDKPHPKGMLGKNHSEKTKAQQRQQIPWNKGKKGSEIAWNKGLPRELQPKYKHHHTEVTLQKMRITRSGRVFPVKDTSIERKIQSQLNELGITYEKQKPIVGQPDFYIPSIKLAIFADGDYWHSPIHKPKIYYRDFTNKQQLELEGHNVIRIPEHEINKPEFHIKKAIQKARPLFIVKPEKELALAEG